jgi:hypothetical protein
LTLPSALPPDMLAAAAAFGDLRLALVIGAGCSSEQPTGLPLSRELAYRAHERLVDDEVLAAGDCDNPDDLSLLADVVFAKTGSQRELVDRMDPRRLRDAPPNEGYRCAVALMLEGIVRSVVTLNFDLAMSHALAEVGAAGRVSMLRGPEEWRRLSGRSIIYLHRNIDCDPDDLVLRTVQLDEGWRDSWQQIVATAAVSTPVCVFVGLGSRASVWAASTELVRQALGSADVYLVGPGTWEASEFAGTLGIDADHYLRLGWGEFMVAVVARTLIEHRRDLVAAAGQIADANGWPQEEIDGTLDRLFRVGIVGLGRARGQWLRQRPEYLPLSNETDNRLAVDLVMGVAVIEKETASEHRLAADSSVEFRIGDRILGRAVLASGGGVMSGEALSTRVRAGLRASLAIESSPSLVLLGGTTAPIGTPAPPVDLIDEPPTDDLVSGALEPRFLTTQELRADPRTVLDTWVIE